MRGFYLTKNRQGLLVVMVLLCVWILWAGIYPQTKKTKENKKIILEEERSIEEMKIALEDTSIQEQYDRVKKENEELYQAYDQSVDLQKQLDEILSRYKVKITARSSQTYEPLNDDIYLNHVAQPTTEEVYVKAQDFLNSSLRDLFQVSKIHIDAELDEKILGKVIDEINRLSSEDANKSQQKNDYLQVTEYLTDRENLLMTIDVNCYKVLSFEQGGD